MDSENKQPERAALSAQAVPSDAVAKMLRRMEEVADTRGYIGFRTLVQELRALLAQGDAPAIVGSGNAGQALEAIVGWATQDGEQAQPIAAQASDERKLKLVSIISSATSLSEFHVYALADSILSALTASAAQQPVALSEDARECLQDVISHHGDFHLACRTTSDLNLRDNDRDSAAYWDKQVDVLARMKVQAERALLAPAAQQPSDAHQFVSVNHWLTSLPEDECQHVNSVGKWELAEKVWDAARAALSQQPSETAIHKEIIEALKFYFEGHHFYKHDPDVWDTVSGEPANFQEDEACTATVEDGSVAKLSLEKWMALRPAAQEANHIAFNPNEKCSPTLTQCPRCNNPHNACDQELGAAQEAEKSQSDTGGRILAQKDIEYPRDVFSDLISNNSPYAFYLFQWVPYQTEAKRWRMKMCHDARTFDGREAHGIWPNGSRCGPFRDDEVEFIRISHSQHGEAWQDPRPTAEGKVAQEVDREQPAKGGPQS